MRIGTRDSRLAMRQTEMFVSSLREAFPDLETEIVPMKALGDVDLVSPLDKMSSVGAFVRELDAALLAGTVDVTVNSFKDVPTLTDPRITVGAVMERDSDADVVLPRPLGALPAGAKVGTSSVRRMRMLSEARPDLEITPLRGNIHTRLSKLDEGMYDAIVLAEAGLERMGIDRPAFPLDEDVFVPAPAQGAIAVECRAEDAETMRVLAAVDHAPTRKATEAERAIMRAMDAGCSSPIGINARPEGAYLKIRAVSYGTSGKPKRVETEIPEDYSGTDISRIADYLLGKTEELRT